MKYRITLSVLVTLLLMSGCAEQESRQVDVQTGSKPVVYVSNYPLHYFIERIAGDLIDIRFPVGLSGDPALWKPGAEDIAAAKALFHTLAEFGGRDLVGESSSLAPGTFWSGFQF